MAKRTTLSLLVLLGASFVLHAAQPAAPALVPAPDRRPDEGRGPFPTLTIRNETGKTATFAAKPTGKGGVYLAKVTFPSDGKWRYEVYDGFTQYGGAKTHTFGAISVGGGGGSDSSFPLVPSIGGAALVLLAAAGLVFLIRRQRRTAPAPA